MKYSAVVLMLLLGECCETAPGGPVPLCSEGLYLAGNRSPHLNEPKSLQVTGDVQETFFFADHFLLDWRRLR